MQTSVTEGEEINTAISINSENPVDMLWLSITWDECAVYGDESAISSDRWEMCYKATLSAG
jgi:hypothetical protein